MSNDMVILDIWDNQIGFPKYTVSMDEIRNNNGVIGKAQTIWPLTPHAVNVIYQCGQVVRMLLKSPGPDYVAIIKALSFPWSNKQTNEEGEIDQSADHTLWFWEGIIGGWWTDKGVLLASSGMWEKLSDSSIRKWENFRVDE